MSGYKTAEEIKKHHIEVMGNELGLFYHALQNELAWLCLKWEEYVNLFGTKPSRIDLLNKAAGHFFRIVQDALWENSLLHIARLTDPPKTMGKENLTIRKLPQLIGDETLREKVSELVDVAVEKADFCRDWRNRHIAHKDLHLALDSSVAPLKSASRKKVKESLQSISDVLNEISKYFMGSITMFEGIICPDDATSLLHIIDDGLRAEKERRERLIGGNYSVEDCQTRDL